MGNKKRKRSKTGEKHREEKKRSRIRTITVVVPHTKGQEQNIPEKSLRLEHSTHIVEPCGDTVIQLFKRAIPKALLEQLLESLNVLLENLPPHETLSNRGKEKTYHLGCWRKSMKEPTITKQTNHPASREFLQKNAELFDFVSKVFHQHYPKLYEVYSKVSMPEKLVGNFGTVAVNVDYATEPHYDSDDFSNGLCWVMPIGNYTGGELRFFGLNIEVDLQPGDLICFQSKHLLHGNNPYEGIRHSLVFFTNHAMFFDCMT